MIYARKEAKAYGTKRLIEGEYRAGERALLVDDVITSGGAKLEGGGAVPGRRAGGRGRAGGGRPRGAVARRRSPTPVCGCTAC